MSTAAAPIVGQEQDWRTSLPEDLRAEKSFEKFKGVPDLAKSYVEIQKTMGSAIRVPKADAPAEEYDALYARLGRPESPEKYEFKRPTVAEGVKYDEDMEKAFKGIAHKNGLSTRQAQGILDSYNELQAGRMSKFTGAMEEGVTGLKKEWGQSFDRNIELARQSVRKLGGDEMVSLLEETGLGNHPAMIKFFSKMGEQIAEDQMILGDTPPNPAGADAIQAKINAIRQDPKHAYNDKRAIPAAHEAALKEMSKLYTDLAAAKGETD